MISGIVSIVGNVVGGIKDHFEGKRKLKKAITDNKIRMAQSEQSHNQNWEMKSLDNAGFKDDVLFYAFIALFVWAGFDPEGAGQFFTNLKLLPEWFVKTWFWLIASVLGVKKIGDYAPGAIGAVKEVLTKKGK